MISLMVSTEGGGVAQAAPLDYGLLKCGACRGLGTSDGQPWSHTTCTWCKGAGFFPFTDAMSRIRPRSRPVT